MRPNNNRQQPTTPLLKVEEMGAAHAVAKEAFLAQHESLEATSEKLRVELELAKAGAVAELASHATTRVSCCETFSLRVRG
jgi:hypothetical protein